MRERKCLVTISTIFFFSAVMLLTLNLLTYQALELEKYKNILRYIGVVCLLLAILFNFGSVRWNLSLFSIFIYSVVMFLFGSEEIAGNAINLAIIILTMWAAQTLSDKNLYKTFYYVAIISIIVWIILILFGFIEITPWDTTRVQGIGSNAAVISRIRYSLGFLYEINLGAWYLTSAFTIIMFCKGVTLRNLTITSVINLVIYIYTDSRTTFLFYILFLLFYMFSAKWKKNRIPIKIFTCRRIIIIITAVFIVPMIVNTLMKYIPWLDVFLSGRLGGIASRMEGMSLFNFLFGWYNQPLACFYYLLFSQFGLIVYFAFYCIFIKAIIFFFNEKKFVEFAMLMACVFVGLAEGSIFAIEEISTLLFWTLIARGISKREKNGKTY